jgi:DNA helicase-2/ATP-dependent DNA helicase PcrA
LSRAKTYDLSAPWNAGVNGQQVLPLINDDAPVIRVEAGPGTGKTFGLVRRVVRLLHPDGLACSGRKVAVVAFNRVIAQQLAQDIESELDNADVGEKPIIQTVHGFCLRVVGENIRILLPHEREAMLYDVLHEHPRLQQAFGRHSDAEQALHDHEANIRKHPELWQAIQRWLIRHKARLISDLPGLLLDRIKGGDFTDAEYDHVIVDEFQDLTPAEQELFLRLRSQDGQLVALGDPRQSIYAFLGNERKGLAKLPEHSLLKRVPIQDCPMTECQRCPTEIVVAANKLMSLSEAMPMKPANKAHAKTLVVYWKTPASEAQGMAQLILDNINRAHADDKHLAMVTRRQFGYRLRDELLKLDPMITIELGFSESILELWPVREAFLFLCLLSDPDPPTWRAWLGYRTPTAETNHLPPQRNAPAYLQFLERCDDVITEKAVLALSKESQTASRGAGGSVVWERASRYRMLLKTKAWHDLEADHFIKAVLSRRLWVTGDDEDAATAREDIRILRANARQIFTEVEASGKDLERDDLLRQVVRQLRYSIATREPLATGSESKLKVTTLWGGKGLTAQHVYVLGLCKEAIPGIRSEEYPGTNADYLDEQRRLFYVTITRSKETLVLSRPQKIKPGEAQRLNLRVAAPSFYYSDLQMCPFLRDIMDTLPDVLSGSALLKARPPFSLRQL